jgi:hypothetical protein
LENLDDGSWKSGGFWGSVEGNTKALTTESVGYNELKQHKPWFDVECSKLLDQKKWLICNGCRIQAKQMEIIRTMSRHETSRIFRNKKI